MRTFASIAAIGAALVLPLAAAPPAIAADETIVIRGDGAGENVPGEWLFNRDQSTSTPYEFTAAAGSIGAGSLSVEPIGSNAPDKFIGEYFAFTSVADFESFSHDFQIAGDGDVSDADQFYVNVYVNLPTSPSSGFYDCRYDFIPSAGSTMGFSTFQFTDDTVADGVASRNGAACGTSISDVDGASTIRSIAINVGDTSANDEGLAGYYDKVVLEHSDGSTTFDFEPTPTKDECKKGGYADFGFRNQGQCVAFANANS